MLNKCTSSSQVTTLTLGRRGLRYGKVAEDEAEAQTSFQDKSAQQIELGSIFIRVCVYESMCVCVHLTPSIENHEFILVFFLSIFVTTFSEKPGLH